MARRACLTRETETQGAGPGLLRCASSCGFAARGFGSVGHHRYALLRLAGRDFNSPWKAHDHLSQNMRQKTLFSKFLPIKTDGSPGLICIVSYVTNSKLTQRMISCTGFVNVVAASCSNFSEIRRRQTWQFQASPDQCKRLPVGQRWLILRLRRWRFPSK